MASPFDVFRKNQKVMMALLVGVSMITFIVADSINATNFPIFLGALFGALGLWLLSGKGGGEGWAIAAAGAVLGAVVGWYGPNLLGDNTAVQTTEGNLSQQDVQRILQRQEQANQFLGMAAATIRERLPEAEQMQLRQPELFGFGELRSPAARRDAAALMFLFQKEADELGITISDSAVTQYLNDAFDGKLIENDLRQVRRDMRVGTGELVDILREQIRAREAFLLLVPRSAPTPEELWAEYKKLETKAEVTAVAVPGEAFVGEVPNPSDLELAAYFDQYKSIEAPAEGEPGFLLPRQFQLAYVAIDMAEMRKSVPPPTDEEVLAYYNAHRSQFEFEQPPPSGARTPVEAPRPEAAGNDAPAESPDGNPAAETNSAEPVEAPKSETPGESSSGVTIDGFEFVAFQEGQAAADGAQPSAGEAVEKPAGAAPSTTEEGDTTPAPPEFPAPPGKPAKPPSPETLAAIKDELLNQRAREEADKRLAKVREDIDRIISEITDAVAVPDDLQDEGAAAKYKADQAKAVRTIDARMEEYAKKNGLKFHRTPLMSAQELLESEDYPIGQAVLWQPNEPFGPRDETTVAQQVFSSSPDQPVMTIPAQSLLDESRYIAIKRADHESRVPKLDDEGVKDRVTKVWKLQRARELAKARAEALAKADDAKKDLAEAVKGQTITGKKGGQELTARQVGPFSWLRRSTVPGAAFSMPDIVPNSLFELPGAGEKFMRAVFLDLGVGATGVVPSEDGSAWYVVEVDSRTSEQDLAKVREGFMKEEFFGFLSPFRMRMFQENQQLRADWFRAFREKHGVTDLAAAEEPAA